MYIWCSFQQERKYWFYSLITPLMIFFLIQRHQNKHTTVIWKPAEHQLIMLLMIMHSCMCCASMLMRHSNHIMGVLWVTSFIYSCTPFSLNVMCNMELVYVCIFLLVRVRTRNCQYILPNKYWCCFLWLV